MSKESDLALTVIAYIKLIEFGAKVMHEEIEKEKLGLRDDDDKKMLNDLMSNLQLAGTKLKENMINLSASEDSHEQNIPT